MSHRPRLAVGLAPSLGTPQPRSPDLRFQVQGLAPPYHSVGSIAPVILSASRYSSEQRNNRAARSVGYTGRQDLFIGGFDISYTTGSKGTKLLVPQISTARQRPENNDMSMIFTTTLNSLPERPPCVLSTQGRDSIATFEPEAVDVASQAVPGQYRPNFGFSKQSKEPLGSGPVHASRRWHSGTVAGLRRCEIEANDDPLRPKSRESGPCGSTQAS